MQTTDRVSVGQSGGQSLYLDVLIKQLQTQRHLREADTHLHLLHRATWSSSSVRRNLHVQSIHVLDALLVVFVTTFTFIEPPKGI